MGQLQPLREDMAGYGSDLIYVSPSGFQSCIIIAAFGMGMLTLCSQAGDYVPCFRFYRSSQLKKLALSLRRNFRLVRIFKT